MNASGSQRAMGASGSQRAMGASGSQRAMGARGSGFSTLSPGLFMQVLLRGVDEVLRDLAVGGEERRKAQRFFARMNGE